MKLTELIARAPWREAVTCRSERSSVHGKNITDGPSNSRAREGGCRRAFEGRLTGAQSMSHYLGKTR